MLSEVIDCPYCGGPDYSPYDLERGYAAVRCRGCGFLYVNPRPTAQAIEAAVRTGVHGNEAQKLNVVARRQEAKVTEYRNILRGLFDDVWQADKPVHWLDVGAGYGEIMEVVMHLAPAGSTVEGLEPMLPKAEQARSRGLKVTADYLGPSQPKAEFISAVDVFSHIPNFRDFLKDVAAALKPGGEIFVETGNLADIPHRKDFPGELGLPDHLTFAGEEHLRGFLDQAGFDVVRIEKRRIDDATYFTKNVIKKILGRPVKFAIPYTSAYRRLLIRARLRSTPSS